MFFLILGLLFLCIIGLTRALNRYKQVFRQENLWGRWPIRKVSLQEISSCFIPEELGPQKSTEITFIGNYGSRGSTSDLETWVLCTLAKGARFIFEFGTFTGKTTYLLAKNAPEHAKVFTLTLPPEGRGEYLTQEQDHKKDTQAALDESIFTQFYYANTVVCQKITQLFADSKQFDETPYIEQMDLIFIDGSHAQSYVESDTQKALRMLRPGGIVIWHDYRGPKRARGVFRTLNALNNTLPLMHIENTSLVAYKKMQ
jgi:predicted O-methyltransferase YrrM